MKKISVITICYNEPNVEKTCESIVNQTWQNFEWIVIDGGSNQETQKVWDKYKYRINKFISEPDNGIYNACNKGIKIADGDYLIFMNAGDWFYHKDILKLYTNYIECNDSDIYYGQCECSFKKPDNIGDYITNYPSKISRDFFILSNICTQGMLISREIFSQLGLFNENYKVCADYEKWLQAIKVQKRFMYVPIIVSTYDLNGISGNVKTRELTLSERDKIRNSYFTSNEICNAENKNKVVYSALELIFSLKNTPSRSHKIITLFGIHLKIKRKTK